MIITDARSELDNNLNDTTTTIFILVGLTDSDAGKVHSLMETKKNEKKLEEFHHFFLSPNAILLTSAEIADWFNGNTSDCYAVLGGKNLPKTIAQQGSITELLKSNGKPDFLTIREKFLKGDLV